MSVGKDYEETEQWKRWLKDFWSDMKCFRYLWISGLFLGFLISTSAAFLWYKANRSLKVMFEDWKCWAANKEQKPSSHIQQQQQTKHNHTMKCSLGLVSGPSCPLFLLPRGQKRHRSYSTFDVVDNGDYVLSKQLRGAATELCWLNVLENGTKLWIFLSGIEQRRAERGEEVKKHG